MAGEPIRNEPTLDLRPLTKELSVADVTDPSNSSVKPGFDSSEGKIAALVAIVTVLGPIVTALAGAMPDSEWLHFALAALAAVTSLFVALGWMKKRSDLKETANNRAAELALGKTAAATALALADKAITVAKDHPELARDLLKNVGIGGGLPK